MSVFFYLSDLVGNPKTGFLASQLMFYQFANSPKCLNCQSNVYMNMKGFLNN